MSIVTLFPPYVLNFNYKIDFVVLYICCIGISLYRIDMIREIGQIIFLFRGYPELFTKSIISDFNCLSDILYSPFILVNQQFVFQNYVQKCNKFDVYSKLKKFF
jgi:hypothetical protein